MNGDSDTSADSRLSSVALGHCVCSPSSSHLTAAAAAAAASARSSRTINSTGESMFSSGKANDDNV
jgi:hypothetical protein